MGSPCFNVNTRPRGGMGSGGTRSRQTANGHVSARRLGEHCCGWIPLTMSQGVITTNELFPHDTWRTHIQTSSCLTSLGGCDSVSCLPTGRNRRRPVMLLTNSGRPAGDSIGSQCHYLCRGIRGACMPLLCPLHPLLCPFYAYPPLPWRTPGQLRGAIPN